MAYQQDAFAAEFNQVLRLFLNVYHAPRLAIAKPSGTFVFAAAAAAVKVSVTYSCKMHLSDVQSGPKLFIVLLDVFFVVPPISKCLQCKKVKPLPILQPGI